MDRKYDLEEQHIRFAIRMLDVFELLPDNPFTFYIKLCQALKLFKLIKKRNSGVR
jgi:hypothetical protein